MFLEGKKWREMKKICESQKFFLWIHFGYQKCVTFICLNCVLQMSIEEIKIVSHKKDIVQSAEAIDYPDYISAVE